MTPSSLAHIAALGLAFWALLLGSVGYLTSTAPLIGAAFVLAAIAAASEALALLLRSVRVLDDPNP